MDEVIEIVDYLNQHPTAAEILAAVHQVKPQISQELRQNLMKEEDFNREMGAERGLVPNVLGSPEIMPDDFRENIRYAQEIVDKIKSNKLDS